MQLDVTIDDVSTTINQKYICKADPCFYLAVRSTDVPREMRISTIDSLHDCEELLFQNFKKATRSSAHFIQLLFQYFFSMLLCTVIVKWRGFTILQTKILANLILNNLGYSTFTTYYLSTLSLLLGVSDLQVVLSQITTYRVRYSSPRFLYLCILQSAWLCVRHCWFLLIRGCLCENQFPLIKSLFPGCLWFSWFLSQRAPCFVLNKLCDQ